MLISTHICHPSLYNDNLSGIAVCTQLAQWLYQREDMHYSYRFLFIPGTIGAITWLAQNESRLSNIKYGLMTSLLGLNRQFTYKRSRRGDTRIDRIVEHVLCTENLIHDLIDFIPYGYDERQFCSPGINLPVGNLCRVPYAQYQEYHTSADNLSLLTRPALRSSYDVLHKSIEHVEGDVNYLNLFPKGEPQLGKKGLYDNLGGKNDSKALQMALLWVLNFSDGQHTLTDIAMRSGMELAVLQDAAAALLESAVIKPLKQL